MTCDWEKTGNRYSWRRLQDVDLNTRCFPYYRIGPRSVQILNFDWWNYSSDLLCGILYSETNIKNLLGNSQPSFTDLCQVNDYFWISAHGFNLGGHIERRLYIRLFQNARQWKFSSRMSDWHFQFETAENVRLTAQQERAHW